MVAPLGALAFGIALGSCGLQATGLLVSAADGSTGPTSDSAEVHEGAVASADATIDVGSVSDAATETMGDASDAGTTEVSTDAPATGCPTLPGPVMVAAGDAGFCIDSTEVTNLQYLHFYMAELSGMGPAEPSFCAAHVYLPSDWTGTAPYYPAGQDDNPESQPDWCDAYMYCAWAGKRLCGAIGGGALGFGDYDNAGASQWYFACSKGGALTYPYGNVYNASTCNGMDESGGTILKVASLPGCVGGFPGLYDMSGNVWEWEDSCTGYTSSSEACRLRGGSCIRPGTQITCGIDQSQPRSYNGAHIGFRCCSP
jgi:formylglycine-generating enzyme required for sulfatase activity